MAAPIKVLTSRNGAIWLTGAMVIAVRMRTHEIGFRMVTPKSSGLYQQTTRTTDHPGRA